MIIFLLSALRLVDNMQSKMVQLEQSVMSLDQAVKTTSATGEQGDPNSFGVSTNGGLDNNHEESASPW